MTLEEIIYANPEVIIAGIGMGTGEDLTYQFALNESRLEDIDARLNNRIYSRSDVKNVHQTFHAANWPA